MIITIQNSNDIFLMLLSSLISGVALSLLYVLFISFPTAVSSLKYVSDGYEKFSRSVLQLEIGKTVTFVSDLGVCLIAACSVCINSYVYNSGMLRFSVVAALILGYLLGKAVLRGFAISAFRFVFFAVAKLFWIVSYPFAAVLKLSCRLLMDLIGRLAWRIRVVALKKFTKYSFDKLEKLAEFGFVDQFYKDMMK